MFSMLASKGVGARTSGGGGGALRAFPGAEGVGTLTRGGSGGTVYIVNTLANSGTGSFREACEASGARIVIFTVTGIIDLTTDLTVTNPYISIYGQTSPGGIIVSGRTFTVQTHDYIAQHVRFRTGTHNATTPELDTLRAYVVSGNGLSHANEVYNVVTDHCSMSWSTDQTVNVWEDAYDVTFSNCLIAEPLNTGHSEGNHAYNFFFWGKNTEPGRQFSAHHNFLAHSKNRNPEINFNGQLDYRNNVHYNADYGGALSTVGGDFLGAILVNDVHNYNKYGPSTHVNNQNKAHTWLESPPASNPSTPVLYSEGTLGEHRTSQAQADNLATSTITYGPFAYTTPAPADYLASTAFAFSESVTTTTMSDAYAQQIVDNAGATVPVRDSVDAAIAADFAAGTGAIRETVTYDTDWPDLVTGAPSPPTDTNSDGIPDDYEVYKGYSAGALSPSGTAPSGYTWIEEYANDLAAGNWSIT